jgi:hypothetical protein
VEEEARLFNESGRILDEEELTLLDVRLSRNEVLAYLLPLGIELCSVSVKGEYTDREGTAVDASL